MPRRPLLAAVALLPLALAGCSGLPDLTPHQRQGTATDSRALELAWSTPAARPDWLPADASRIRWIAATTGGADRAPAALRVRSAAPLPASCTTAEGVPGPAITASWTPREVPARVRRCGHWAVVPVPGGYAAWTPVERDATG